MTPPDFILAIAEKLSASSLGTTIAESSWFFPALEVAHVIGLTIVVGTIAVVDLRLLNASFRHRPITRLTEETLPFTYTGFGLAVITGLLMFISDAVTYVENPALQLKFALLIIAGINIAIFHRMTYKNVAGWDLDVVPPFAARMAGAVSLASWVLIVVCGRWIAFIE
ncbi:DUF6644 family protein [Sphingobium subterraneum]|uniref:DUF6644 domain-containing protein n=1 Tax=Sphingobium subterraneum TaxID=627688 RepID=A0A841J4G8_9SPHN|nr:DUF6644 family protein [Sphingobium subterraneum]MBB6123418.1 hypothetical protein [Sphingobium subterraneum]